MWIVTLLVLIDGGAIAAANLIVAKQPNAKQMIDKLTPYQGMIGIVLLATGLWGLIHVVRGLGVFSLAPLAMTLALAASVMMIALGFLLGFSMISRYALSGNADAMAKGEAIRTKIAVYQ